MTKQEKGLSTARKKELIFYCLMFALPVLQILIFYFYVNFRSISLAFTEYDAETGKYFFVGIENFIKIIEGVHPKMSNFNINFILKNTSLAFTMELLFGFIPAIFFSYYIFKKYPLSGVFKVILYTPHIVSTIIFVVIYRNFVESALPQISEKLFGIEIQDVFNQVNEGRTRFFMIFFTVFIGFGTRVLLYSGAMSSISESVIESGELEGVKPLQELVFIVVPLIWGTVVTFLVVCIVGIFSNQMTAYSFFGESLDTKYYTFGYYLYYRATKLDMAEYPYLSTLGLLMTLFAVPVTLCARYLLNKYGPRTD